MHPSSATDYERTMATFSVRCEGHPLPGRATRTALSFLGADGRYGFVALRVVDAPDEAAAVTAAADEIRGDLAAEIGTNAAAHFEVHATHVTALPATSEWKARGLLWHSQTATRSRRLRNPRGDALEQLTEQNEHETYKDGRPEGDQDAWLLNDPQSDAAS